MRLIISGFHLGLDMQDQIRKASIPQLITYQLKFRDTTLELSALLTLLAVLSQESAFSLSLVLNSRHSSQRSRPRYALTRGSFLR